MNAAAFRLNNRDKRNLRAARLSTKPGGFFWLPYPSPRILPKETDLPAESHLGPDEVFMKTRSLVACCCLLIGPFALADDWPQYRGPDRSGVSKEKGLLKAWPKGGPKLLWTYRDAGIGFSSMAISKGVVYTLGTDLDGKDGKTFVNDEYVIAIGEKDGKEKWRVKIAPLFTGSGYGDGPRSTPTIDGNRLFALSGAGQFVCVDIGEKKIVWGKHLVKDLGGVLMDRYGFSESPLVDGKLLICTPGGPKGTLAALDKTNGNIVWRSKDLVNTAPFSSAVAAEIHGVRQYIQCSYDATLGKENAVVSGIDANTGERLWSGTIFKGTNDLRGISAAPIVAATQVYVTTDIKGCQLFEIDKNQKATALYTKMKTTRNVRNAHGGVVLIHGKIYGHTEPGMWICQDLKTGGIEWDDNVQLKCASGAVIAADGKLLLYTDRGQVGLVDADPDPKKGFNLISSFEIPVKSNIPAIRPSSGKAQIWTHPAIANGVLYLRDHEYIFAYQIK
jgi:outer membrane protein assembly factor BamB